MLGQRLWSSPANCFTQGFPSGRGGGLTPAPFSKGIEQRVPKPTPVVATTRA